MKKIKLKRGLALLLVTAMMIGLMSDYNLAGYAADNVQIGISGEKMTAPINVSWDLSPEHFGEGSWTPTTNNQWDWVIRIYRDKTMVHEESIGSWCRMCWPLAAVKGDGELAEGNYTFTVQPRDKSSRYSDEKDIVGVESQNSDIISYKKASFEAANLSWNNTKGELTWVSPKYAGEMTLTLYKKGASGADEIIYKCQVDAKTTSFAAGDYITSAGTYYFKLENKNSMFIDGGSVLTTDDIVIDGNSLPSVTGLSWKTEPENIGIVGWTPVQTTGAVSYAVNLYKDGVKLTTIYTDKNELDLYPYLAGYGKYSVTVQTFYPGIKDILGNESPKCTKEFDSTTTTAPSVQFKTDAATNTNSTVTWTAPDYVTSGVYRVELYQASDKVTSVTVRGTSVNLYDDMQAGGSSSYTVKVSGQVRDNAGVYGSVGTVDTLYTYVDEGTGDFIVTGGVIGKDYTYAGNELTVLTGIPLTISGTTTKDRIKIKQGITANVTFDNICITKTKDPLVIGTEALDAESGTVLNLTLIRENTLNPEDDFWDSDWTTRNGIWVGNSTLNVYGNGRLTAKAGLSSYLCYGGAGICVFEGGTVNVHSGTIIAKQCLTRNHVGAGIGSLQTDSSNISPNAGTVNIYGGSVTAEGGTRAACIGVGSCSYDGANGGRTKTMKGFSANNSWFIANLQVNPEAGTAHTAVGGGVSTTQKDLETESNNSVVIKKSPYDANGLFSWSSTVYGNPVITNSEPENPAGNTLTIPVGQTVTIGNQAVLTNNGTIDVYGTLKIAAGGILINNGTINIKSGGKVIIEDLNETINYGSLKKGMYPSTVFTKTETKVSVLRNGSYTDITADTVPVYGDTIRIRASVINNADGSVLTDLNDDSYQILINGNVVNTHLKNGSAEAEIILTGAAWSNWQFGKNMIKTKLSLTKYSRSGVPWGIRNTEAEKEINVKKTNLVVSGSVSAEGTYGDSLADITPSGKVVLESNGEEIAGSWMFERIQNGNSSVSVYPEVGGNTAYNAVFIPEDTSLGNVVYCDLTVSVVPAMTYLAASESPYVLFGSYTDGKNVWVQEDDDTVRISPAKGYKMSDNAFGSYKAYAETTLKAINNSTDMGYYLKNLDGHITAKLKLNNYVQKDSTAPDIGIAVGNQTYNAYRDTPVKDSVFLNLKNGNEITITAEDAADTGSVASGIQSTYYCVIDQASVGNGLTPQELEVVLAASQDSQWLPYDKANGIRIGRPGTYVVVAKATDNLGNVSYANTDGLVVYQDSELSAGQLPLTYTRLSGQTRQVSVIRNGNALDSITCTKEGEAGYTLQSDDYTTTVSTDNTTETITFSADFLAALKAGKYTIAVSLKPQDVSYGNTGDAPAVLKTSLTVSLASLDATFFNFTKPADLTFTNTVKNANVTLKDAYSGYSIGTIVPSYYKVTESAETPINGSPVESGNYVMKLDITGLNNELCNTLTGKLSSEDWKFTISYLQKPETPYTIAGNYTDAAGNIWIRSGENAVITPKSGYTAAYDSDYAPDKFKNQLTYGEAAVGNSISVRLKDAAGHITDAIPVTQNIKKDSTAPADITVKYGENTFKQFLNTITFGLFFNENVEVTLSATDSDSGLKEFQYRLGANGDVNTIRAVNGKATFNIEKEFIGSIHDVKAVDNAGNISAASDYEYFALDKTLPTAPKVDTGVYTANTWTKDSVTVTVSDSYALSGIAKYQYSADGGTTWTDMASTEKTSATAYVPANVTKAELTVSENTNAEYIFRAVANTGANGTVSSKTVVKIDKTEPSIQVSGDTDTIRTSDTVTINAAAGGSGKTVEVSKDGGGYTGINGTTFNVTENGTYTFRVTNGAGVLKTDTITYGNIDTKSPAAVIDSGAYTDGTWTDKDITLMLSNATENLGNDRLEYRIDGGEWTEYTEGLHITSDTDSDGTVYTFKVTAENGLTDEKSITVMRDTGVPTATIHVEENNWKGFIDKITFGIFCNDRYDVTVNAEDNVSGIRSVEYFLSETAVSGEDIKAVTDWKTYSDFCIDKEGKYIIYVRLTDNTGNISYISSDGMIVDKTVATAPKIDTGAYTANTWTKDSVTFTVSDSYALSGIAKYQYSADGGTTWTDMASTEETSATAYVPANVTKAELTVSENTNAEYIFRAVANTGANGTVSSKTVVKIDKTEPSIQVSGDTDTIRTSDTVTINAAAGGSGKTVEVSKDGGDYTGIGGTTFNVTENGTYTFRVTNGVGVSKTDTITYGNIDTKSPAAVIDSGAYTDGTWTDKDITLMLSNATENLGADRLEYRIDGGEWTEYTEGLHITSDTDSDGTVYTFKVTAENGLTDEKSITVMRDTTAPTATIHVKENNWKGFINKITFGIFCNDRYDVTVNAEDNASGIRSVEYFLSETAVSGEDIKAVTDWKTYSDFCIDKEGKYIIYVRLTDNTGNISYISSDGMIVDKTLATAPKIDTGAYTADTWTKDSVTFTVSDSYALSGIAKYQYSTDGGTTWTDMAAAEAELTLSENTNAEYIFRAVANTGAVGTPTAPTVVKIDKTEPSIQVSVDTDTIKTSDNVTINAAAGGSGKTVEVSKDGGDYTVIGGTTFNVTENGTYTFRVTNGVGVSKTDTITYTKLDVESPAAEIGSADYTDSTWTDKDITLMLSNATENLGADRLEYRIDGGEWTEYTEGLHITSDTDSDGTVYTFKVTAENGLINEKSITVKRDTTAPTATIHMKENNWKGFIDKITFGIFCNDRYDVTVEAEDNASGIRSAEYFLSETAVSGEDIKAVTDWKTYSDFCIDKEGKYIIYVRLTDNTGNISYISSDGIIVDKAAPVISGITNGAVYCAAVEVGVSDEYLDTVTLNGETVTLTDGRFMVNAKAGVQTIITTDKAGNTTTYMITVNDGSPNMGDGQANLLLWLILAFILSGTIIGTTVYAKNKKQR